MQAQLEKGASSPTHILLDATLCDALFKVRPALGTVFLCAVCSPPYDRHATGWKDIMLTSARGLSGGCWCRPPLCLAVSQACTCQGRVPVSERGSLGTAWLDGHLLLTGSHADSGHCTQPVALGIVVSCRPNRKSLKCSKGSPIACVRRLQGVLKKGDTFPTELPKSQLRGAFTKRMLRQLRLMRGARSLELHSIPLKP